MKLSIFTTCSEPVARGDTWFEAMNCYHDFADEVVVVDGTPGIDASDSSLHFTETMVESHKFVYHEWPKEFDWPLIGQQFQRGYEACTGDWVLHMDIDWIIHEDDFKAIRQALGHYNDEPAVSLYKYQFIHPDCYNLKSRLVVAVNKGKFGDRIRFDSGGDLCQPSLDGRYINPDQIPESRMSFYNYEKILKTKEQVKEDVGRMARAWHRHHGDYKLGGPDDESAFNEWKKMVIGRYSKPQTPLEFDKHPKYIKETIKNLTPDQWGYNGWGLL